MIAGACSLPTPINRKHEACMKKMNAYFTIGTAGVILTGILQIILTITAKPGVQVLFFILYPIFIICLYIGFRKIVKEKKTDSGTAY